MAGMDRAVGGGGGDREAAASDAGTATAGGGAGRRRGGGRHKGWFAFRRYVVRQELCGMKVGTDALLLGGYAAMRAPDERRVWGGRPWPAHPPDPLPPLLAEARAEAAARPSLDPPSCCPRDPARVLDIGTGSGVIALMLADTFRAAAVDALDIDAGAARQARLNAAAAAPALAVPPLECPRPAPPVDGEEADEGGGGAAAVAADGDGALDTGRIAVHHTPVQLFGCRAEAPVEGADEGEGGGGGEWGGGGGSAGGLYELIVSAPPYFKSDADADRWVGAMDTQRRIARHTHTLYMEDLIQASERLLAPERGRMKVIVSLPYPADELDALLASPDNSTELLERVVVSDHPGSKPLRVMYTWRVVPAAAERDDGRGAEPARPPVHRTLPIYAQSYRAAPAVHREYSAAYRHMLVYNCTHFLPADA